MPEPVDYSVYSVQQLREAEAGIDRARFPENYDRLREELTRRGAVPAPMRTAPVEPSQIPEIPRSVRTAVRLLWASIGIGILNAILDWNYLTSQVPAVFAALVLIFTMATIIWLTHKISLRRNWARITFLVLSILGMIVSFTHPSQMLEGPVLSVILSIAVAMLQLGALVFLFLRPSGQWFRSAPALHRAA